MFCQEDFYLIHQEIKFIFYNFSDISNKRFFEKNFLKEK